MDPLVLAGHVHPAFGQKVIDIGCGCGIIPLILASRHPGLKITGIEIQKELCGFARQNVIASHLENTIQIIHEDVRNIRWPDIQGKADIIVSNPPYKKKNTGRLNPDAQKAIARHEICLDLDTLLACSNRLLNRQGKIYIIFPAERVSDLILGLAQHGFGLDTLRFVHIRKDLPARRVIVCGKKGRHQPCIVAPPLHIYSSEDQLTEDYAGLMATLTEAVTEAG